MTLPRASLVDPAMTPYYHCISRCVRRAFLCGEDATTGRSFEHRRAWIVERLAALSEVFAVHVCGYALMSNHHHLVLKLDPDAAAAWTDTEVLERWCSVFSGPVPVQRFLAGESLSQAERTAVDDWARVYRARLCDLSWFMRCLNEPIARWANAEDGCTGRFWEGRFKSQALLDEAALMSCLAYVDLNPIRAGLAQKPENAEFTSIRQRAAEEISRPASESLSEAVPRLLGFHDQDPNGLPCTFRDYLELVDWSGRAIRTEKQGSIPPNCPTILDRLGIQPRQLAKHVARPDRRFHHMLGSPASIRRAAARLHRRFFKGQAAASQLFASQAN